MAWNRNIDFQREHDRNMEFIWNINLKMESIKNMEAANPIET
jgi:hypothetical protein